jgi:ELMO domain-containing protein
LKFSAKPATADEHDNEFDFDTSTNAAENALELALKQAAMKSAEDLIAETVAEDEDEEDAAVPEVAMIDKEEMIDYRSSAQAAFNELKSIYSSGLGDVEVRLLDANSTAAAGKDGRPVAMKEAASVHKSLMNDVIHEGDEEAELEDEVREIEEINLMLSAQQSLAQEWENLDSSQPGTANSILNEGLVISYQSILTFLQAKDLSNYKSMIVTKEESSSSWLSAPAKLNYPNSDAQLELPFLIAQVDYNPAVAEHIACLRRIYQKLIHPSASDDEAVLPCPTYGPHWERIGFQGLDPVTDLNRSMKMFAVLQALHLVDSDVSFSLALHLLSGSNLLSSSSSKSDKRVSVVDKSWPFMCVSVMFTREAIQALRRGDLNKEANQRQDIMSVVHDFHHACFYDFAKRLLAAPNKHHAEVLKELRDACQSNPSSLLKSYLSAVKARKGPQDSLIGSSDHIQAYHINPAAPTSAAGKAKASAPGDELHRFDELEAVGEIEIHGAEGTSSTNQGFWSSLTHLTGRANKFKA